MKEYLNNPDVTASTFTGDGWFKAGDIGLLSEPPLLAIGKVDKVCLKKMARAELENVPA